MDSHYAAKLVEKQMRNWELARAQRPSEPRKKKAQVEDFICVSRMIGAGGPAVAELLGQRLGWPVFDKEVLEYMAGDDFDRKQIYASVDERDLSWTESMLRSFFESGFVRHDYFHRLGETLLLLVRKGPAVFLGRGADLILPRDHGFRVRLTASLENRLTRFATDRQISRGEARRLIEQMETERERFFDRHFKVDPNDPSRYDVTINMERFDVERAVEVILAARRIFTAAPEGVAAGEAA